MAAMRLWARDSPLTWEAAKGYASDCVAEIFAQYGVESGMISLGWKRICQRLQAGRQRVAGGCPGPAGQQRCRGHPGSDGCLRQ